MKSAIEKLEELWLYSPPLIHQPKTKREKAISEEHREFYMKQFERMKQILKELADDVENVEILTLCPTSAWKNTKKAVKTTLENVINLIGSEK